MKCPLDKATWLKFVDGSLSAGESRRLASHLEADCPQCDEFLNSMGLDNSAEGLTWLLQEIAEDKVCDDEPPLWQRERVFGQVMGALDGRAARPGFVARMWIGSLPAALLALIVIAVFTNIPVDRRVGVKGPRHQPPAIVLQAAVLKSGADTPPARAISGQILDQNDILIFRYELASSAYVYLVRTDGREIELIDPPPNAPQVKHERGVYQFQEGGNSLGYKLEGLDGRQVFLVVASKNPMDFRLDIKPLILKYLENGAAGETADYSFDSYEINVKD